MNRNSSKIINSNTYSLAAQQRCGASLSAGDWWDDVGKFRQNHAGLSADVILTTGGVSV
jgi:molybdopterin biosynthesis enzyme